MNPSNDNDPGQIQRDRHARSRQYRFTAEEIRVIKECNKDSFFQRCLPFGVLFGGSTYYAVKSGFLKPSAKFGATPKVIAAVVMGYFFGKFSFQSKCAERLMQLPNSQLGEMLRQKRRGNLKESMESGFGPAMSLAPFGGISSSDTYSDLNPNNSLDIDTSRPENPGLDDYHRPSVDNPLYEEEMPPIQKHMTTYDELRKLNREEYQQKRIGNYKEFSRQVTPSAPSASSSSGTENDNSAPKNKYGDTWG